MIEQTLPIKAVATGLTTGAVGSFIIGLHVEAVYVSLVASTISLFLFSNGMSPRRIFAMTALIGLLAGTFAPVAARIFTNEFDEVPYDLTTIIFCSSFFGVLVPPLLPFIFKAGTRILSSFRISFDGGESK